MAGPFSIVEYFAEHDGYKCGYCGQTDTNYSHVMWAHQLSTTDYQDLIDRGWRRSGKTVYKPTMNVMCCPHYTIRCRALEFKLNKSHKKQIKKVNKYLITGVKPGGDGAGDDEEDIKGSKDTKTKATTSTVKPQDTEMAATQGQSASVSSESTNQTKPTQSHKHTPKPGSGADPNKPKCKKAKELRAERKAMKMSMDETPGPSYKQKAVKQNTEKSLEDLLSEPDQAENPAHKLEIRLLRSTPRSEGFQDNFYASHQVYKKYQMGIHKDPPTKPNRSQYKRFLCESPLQIRLCRSSPVSDEFRSSLKSSYTVYKKYQMAIHKDAPEDCDLGGYQSFLANSPLQEHHGGGAPPMGYGSFHQQYLIDGKIVAVGVIDILPSCVSSVYLYYDPEYSFLGLGVYTALREIQFVRQLQRTCPELQYYYMGFYIHSCAKMQYKAQFHPSDLACPESYQWVPISRCLPKLEASPYSRLSEESAEDENKITDVTQVPVLNNGKALPYTLYKMVHPQANDEAEVKEYAGLVGKACAERILLYRK